MKLDGYSYRALVTAAARGSDTAAARKWFGRAKEHGEAPILLPVHAYATECKIASNQNDLIQFKQVHQQMNIMN